MNKFAKIALAASTMLVAISFTLGCSKDKDEEKWCVIETTTNGASAKSCFKIGPTIYKNELMCLATDHAEVVDPPSKNECFPYDDGK